MTYLQSNDDVLDIKPTILSKSFRDDKESVSKGLHPHLDATLSVLLDCAAQICRASNLECASPRNETFVLDSILDCAQAVSEGILDLLSRVRVGPFDQKGN